MARHPDWVEEMRVLLTEPANQRIIAEHNDVFQRVTQSLTGSGQQTIEARDNKRFTDIKQIKK